MSLDLNNVIIAGRLTRDPEVKILAGDRPVCSFGMAVNRRYKDKSGEQKEETTFVEVVAWGRTAELVGQYLRKGSPAYIAGRLTQDSWEDKETGKKQTKTKVTADTVQFLGTKPQSEREPEPTTAMTHAKPVHRTAAPSVAHDDVSEPPFARSELELLP